MNYYAFHIGDYASATAHLSVLEDCFYRRLLDVYYVRESPIPADERQVFRLVRAQSEDEREAVRVVLSEFFKFDEAGFRHSRCDAEIKRASEKKEKAKASANARWNHANADAPAVRTQCDRNANAYANASENLCERIENECEGNAPNPNPNKKKTPPTPRKRGEPDGFADFYAAYPRHIARGKAALAFSRQQLGPDDIPMLRAAIAAQRDTPQWRKDDGEFIPHPATWLNQRRWLDEVTTQSATVTPLRRVAL